MTWSIRARAVVLVPVILVWTGIMAVLSLVFSLVDRNGALQHGCARTWALWIIRVSGARLRVLRGTALLDRGPLIFVSNHQSFFDIFALLACLPVQFRFLAKESLFRVPFLGWHLRRAGHVPVDRANPRVAYRSLQSAVEQIRAGTSVLIFPEGSRSETGQVGSFKKGSLRLALASGAPVVPVAIYGTSLILPKGSMWISPGDIDVCIGERIRPPADTAKSQEKENFVETVHAEVARLYRELESARRNAATGLDLIPAGSTLPDASVRSRK